MSKQCSNVWSILLVFCFCNNGVKSGNVERRCGVDWVSALKSCHKFCPDNTDDECDFANTGEKCFSFYQDNWKCVGSEGGYVPIICENCYCGNDWYEAATECDSNKLCQYQVNDECDNGETCWNTEDVCTCVESIDVTSVVLRDSSITSLIGHYIFDGIDSNGYPQYTQDDGSGNSIYFIGAPSDIPVGSVRINTVTAYGDGNVYNDVDFYTNYIEIDSSNFNNVFDGNERTWVINHVGFPQVTATLNDCPMQGIDFV